MKVERQGDEMFSTDLGPVSFGPIDVKDTETGPMNPYELADLLELTLDTCEELDMADEDERIALQDLIVELRLLPADLPPPGEGGISMGEHPMFQLMWEAAPSFLRLWPMVQLMLRPNLLNPVQKIGMETMTMRVTILTSLSARVMHTPMSHRLHGASWHGVVWTAKSLA